MFNTLLDILLPKKCLGCGQEGRYLCQKCSLFISEAPIIYPTGLKGLISIWEYEGMVKKLLSQIKDKGLKQVLPELVENAFISILNDEARFHSFLSFLLNRDTYITYVPLDKKKEKQRGFNQAELIAQEIGKISGKRVVPLLKKIKKIPDQTGLNKADRLTNVKDSFAKALSDDILPNSLLLVDDVWVTGSIMKECSKVLKESGANNIWGFTLARIV